MVTWYIISGRTNIFKNKNLDEIAFLIDFFSPNLLRLQHSIIIPTAHSGQSYVFGIIKKKLKLRLCFI